MCQFLQLHNCDNSLGKNVKSYILNWEKNTWDRKSKQVTSGAKIDIDYVGASAIWPFTDIKAGDEIFVVSVRSDEFYIGGRMIADGESASKDVALKRLGDHREFDWARYIFGKTSNLDSFRSTKKVSFDEVRHLQLINKDGTVTNPKIKDKNKIEHQHFRNPRQISSESANTLRAVLGLDVDAANEDLANDIDAIAQDKSIDSTTRSQLIAARIGQGEFRKNVIAVWGRGEQCALTGIALRDVLVASHIRPWKLSSNEERLAGTNGLLLISHLDKLFDRYLISFEQSGKIVFSKRLTINHCQDIKSVGININLKLDFVRVGVLHETEIKKMLSEHRNKLEQMDQS